MNKVLQKDIELLAEKFEFKNNLKNKSVLITGATGLLGSFWVRFLDYLNTKDNLNIKIIATARNVKKVEALNLPTNVTFIINDMKEPILYDNNVDYIIHTASPTQSSYMVEHPVELINDTIIGAINILNFAKEKDCKGFVYLSSLEVYGQILEEKLVDENTFGYINNLSVRSSYPESKKLIECLCHSYAKEYNVPVKIARLTQTFGAGAEINDNRVFMQFTRSVINNKNIELQTEGLSARCYLYITDAINAMFYILFKGESGQAYNVANKDTYISAKNLAKFMIDNFNKNINLIINKKENTPYGPETKLNLDVSKLTSLGWEPYYSLYDSFKNLIEYVKSLNEGE